MIGQIIWTTQSIVLIGQRSVIRERRSSQFHSFDMLTHAIGLNNHAHALRELGFFPFPFPSTPATQAK